MTWYQWYHIKKFIRNTFWLFPMLAIVVALGSARLMHPLQGLTAYAPAYNPENTRALLAALASAMFTFIVFVSSSLLLAVQLATAQLTPRIIATVFNDPVTKLSSTVFAFSFTFTLAVLIRVESSIPPLMAKLASYSCLVSLGLFFYLIEHLGKTLRPSGALRLIARQGLAVIESVYPRHLSASSVEAGEPADFPREKLSCTIVSHKGGVVLALDVQGLAALAERADCVIEVVPQVGNFVAVGEPLFRIYGDGERLPVRALYHSIILGQERTLEQDPTFVIRVMVDIASKGLSPAINDPTTAVLAIDQIHHMLRNIGRRHLDTGRVRDAAGWLRLIYRTPDWNDFVYLAITEIRIFGGESIQIIRRMRAMLENLIQTLPEERASLLRQELDLFHRAAQRVFPDPEDQALADVSDPLGVGGRSGNPLGA